MISAGCMFVHNSKILNSLGASPVMQVGESRCNLSDEMPCSIRVNVNSRL